jgi:hypothetical protein
MRGLLNKPITRPAPKPSGGWSNGPSTHQRRKADRPVLRFGTATGTTGDEAVALQSPAARDRAATKTRRHPPRVAVSSCVPWPLAASAPRARGRDCPRCVGAFACLKVPHAPTERVESEFRGLSATTRPIRSPKSVPDTVFPSRRAECHDTYPVLVHLTDKVRVIECRDRLQWILQCRRSVCPNSWRGVSFCRMRESLLRCTGRGGPAAMARLHALPELFPEAPQINRNGVKGGGAEDAGRSSGELSILDDLLRRNEPPGSANSGLCRD